MKAHHLRYASLALASALAACAGDGDGSASAPDTPTQPAGLPQLGAATGSTLASCTDLVSRISFPNTTITASNDIAAGTLSLGGSAVPAHCQITGKMNQRIGLVDGQSYAIGFEIRLPYTWNGRFYYQANGGTDGSVSTAQGALGGGPLNGALKMGFAVISSDAGHAGNQNPSFGVDPQARLDYGYQAVAALTPMAKSAIQTAYGKGPDRSYFGGCSNGGRHTFVAMARYADQYDGFLAGDPGFRLPLAAVANMAGAQAYNALATTAGSPATGFTAAERALVSKAVLGKCDALDGSTDGMVQDAVACQAAFNIDRDVPTCTAARDGTCLSSAQKVSIAHLFAGATTSDGSRIYSSFPYDYGLGTNGWASWKFSNSLNLDPGAVGIIWDVTPQDPSTFNAPSFALNSNIDTLLAKLSATDATYTESALSFMLPPDPTNLSALKNRGAKIMVYHGNSDPIFSVDDTTNWYTALGKANGGDASNFARLFRVPGMNHCSGGPATDQFDMLTPLVNWVENGQAPDSVVASARGAGNAGGVNGDVPTSWSPARTRPLCAFPKVAKYNGSGDVESAASFTCQSPS